MRGVFAGANCVLLALWIQSASGQETRWRPAASSPVMAAEQPAVRLGSPIVTLGRPILDEPPVPAPIAIHDQSISQTSYSQPANPWSQPVVTRAQSGDMPRPMPMGPPVLGQPVSVPSQSVTTFSPAIGPGVPPPPPPPVGPGGPGISPEELYNSGAIVGDPLPGGPAAGPGNGCLFGREWLGCTTCGTRRLFESDHCFDGLISPVSNPFLFEDPRSLTEIRPVYIYQNTHPGNYIFQGGDINFLGLQARLAITERLSIVMNKLGWIWIDPDAPGSGVAKNDGFSELWIGPKYTFLRNEDWGSVAALGLTFEIPSGPTKVFQHTGDLSLVPYISYAQSLGSLPRGYGSFNFQGTFGYSASTDNQRSDYLFTSLHLDYDVGNLHRFYPLLEMNWFHYTKSGTATTLGFEGRDLINFGSTGVAGNNGLTMATGFRYKFTEHAQTGLAVEFPLIGARDLLDFRLTVDFIFRY